MPSSAYGPGDLDPMDADKTHTITIPAGRIVHDERGNALWKWRGDSSSTDGSSGILKHIDVADLAVDGVPSVGIDGKVKSVPEGDGYDPYNQGGARKVRRS